MSHLDYQGPAQVLDFKDKSGALIAVGILLALMAAGWGCITATIPLGIVAQQVAPQNQPQTPIREMITGLLILLAMTVIFGWLAIGAILKRRWVRPLTLILCTHWAIVGVGLLNILAATYPMTRDTFRAQGLSGTATVTFFSISVGVTAVLLLALPVTLLMLMRPIDVRRTLEYYDPIPRWTDQRSITLLGGVLTMWAMASFLLLNASADRTGLFGILLTGPLAVLVMLVEAVLYALSGLWLYLRKRRGIVLSVITTAALTVSYILTTLFVPMDELMPQASANPVVIPQEQERLYSIVIATLTAVLGVSLIVYILRLRKELEKREGS